MPINAWLMVLTCFDRINFGLESCQLGIGDSVSRHYQPMPQWNPEVPVDRKSSKFLL